MQNNQYIIHLLSQGNKVRIVPNRHLDENLFTLYREACRKGGALYEDQRTGYTVSLNGIHDVIESLRTFGFQPNVSPQLFNIISNTNPLSSTNKVNDWIKTIQSRLAEKDLHLRTYQEEAVRILFTQKSWILADEMGTGKQQPVDTPVLTPDGWKRIGDLKIGDPVIGRNGQTYNVTGVFPQGVVKNYRITFSDKSTTECGDEHLWTVEYLRGGRKKAEIVVSTKQLRNGEILTSNHDKAIIRLDLSKTPFKIPLLTSPVQFNQSNKLDIDPYILGCLIANGGLTDSTPNLSINKNDEIDFINQLTKRGINFTGPKSYSDNCSRFNLLGLGILIRKLGLNVKSGKKFIPIQYLRSSINDRLDLLRGLMDCDGHVSKERCKVSYTSTSKKLIDDVTELIEQLGGQCRLNVIDRRDEEKGIEYKINIKVPTWVGNPFSVNRKAARYTPGSHARPCRTIESIVQTEDKESVCISVDSPDQLYVTEHCIVTHNTSQSICAVPDKSAVLVICPAIAKENVWKPEFNRFRPEFKTTVLQGLNSFRWPKSGEVIITNYNILPEAEQIKAYPAWGIKADKKIRMVAHRCYDINTKQLVTVPFTSAPPPNLVIIVDEIHNLMNLSAKRTKAFRGIVNAAKRVDAVTWGLTGTELDSNPMQLWNLLTIFGLEKQAYKSWSNFLRIYGGTQTGYGIKKDKNTGKLAKGFGRSIEWRVPGPNDPPNKEAIEGMRRVSLKRKLEDVMPEIPPMTIKDIYVEIDEITRKQCDKALDELKELGISLDDAINHCIDTRDGGVPFKEMAIANKMLAIAKTPLVLEFIEDYEAAKEPILVFSMHRAPLDLLGKRKDWDIITGSVSDKKRSEIVNRFQSGKLDKLGLSIKAAGVALTLDRSANSFFIDFAYTPAANRQAYARIRRFSQRRPQFIFRFIANHALDKRKMELLDAREAIISKTTDAASVKGSATHLFNDEAAVVGHGVLVTDPRTYRIRVQAKRYHARNPKEIWIEKMMREMARRDSDQATLFNQIGFSKADSKIGLDLVGQLKMGWTDRQWLTAERVLNRYQSQIGTFENPKIK